MTRVFVTDDAGGFRRISKIDKMTSEATAECSVSWQGIVDGRPTYSGVQRLTQLY